MKTVSVIGGDLRALTLARLLRDDGYDVSIYGFDRDISTDGHRVSHSLCDALAAEVIVLPIPVSSDGININAPYAAEKLTLDEFFAGLGAARLVLAGHMSKKLSDRFDKEGIVYIDYYNREELVVKNTVPTAEGAIEIAISETPVTLNGANVLVVGYGRIGKVLTRLLLAFGANVTASARRLEDMAWIEASGAKAIHTGAISAHADEFDVIFNTVPTTVIDEQVLGKIKPETPVIDLASVPGGVDLEAAKSLKRRIIWALSLPGKTAPITAGKIIKDTIKNILTELEVG